MVTLVFEYMDQPDVDQEKEFATIAEAQNWLLGCREEDFNWIQMFTVSGYELAECYSEILEL
jgi:hypothetical protein